MDIKQFKKIIDNLKKVSDRERRVYGMKVDLFEFTDEYHLIISALLEALYGEAGADWIAWYCYENDFGRGSLKAYDKDNKEICNTIESLYKTVRNED